MPLYATRSTIPEFSSGGKTTARAADQRYASEETHPVNSRLRRRSRVAARTRTASTIPGVSATCSPVSRRCLRTSSSRLIASSFGLETSMPDELSSSRPQQFSLTEPTLTVPAQVPALRRFLGRPLHKKSSNYHCAMTWRECCYCSLKINVNDWVFCHLFFDNQGRFSRSLRVRRNHERAQFIPTR